MGKVVVDQSSLCSQLTEERKNKKVIFTNGCFDLLHVGHVRYLNESKSLGDILVIGVNSDSSVQRLKGAGRPIQSQDDRAEILAGLASVDYTTIFDEDTPENLIKALKPDILVKGGDWPVEKIVGANFVKSYGGEVRPLQFMHGRSTTLIVEKMRD